MIDNCKQQKEGFPAIFAHGDFHPSKDEDRPELKSQRSLKEATITADHAPVTSSGGANTGNGRETPAPLLKPALLQTVLQLRLQQRRTREQLVDQGIMPPLKSPAAFHEQIKSLERARTENFLKHKIRSRPDRSELVRMHILEETLAEPSLQATQMKLKRARLADDLNEKIAQRPGPMELVEKNILPVDSSVKEAIIVGQVNYPKTLDEFDEDSSDALSPEQPASQESQSSAASPGEPKVNDSPSPLPNAMIQYHPPVQLTPEFLKPASASDQQPTRSTAATTPCTSTVSSAKPGPTLVKQSQSKSVNDKHRSKKSKEPKPRVKKLKYHQYIPPDQKGEKLEPQMDSNYARLLQQQQLFLQLQILSQQQQHYNYQTILPAPLKPVNDNQNNGNTVSNTLSNSTSTAVTLVAGSTARQNNNTPIRKPGPLPSNLDDMKVAELKMELKLRGLPVSGTKTDLIERLKPYQQDSNNSGTVSVCTSTAITNNLGEMTVAFPVTSISTVPSISTEVPVSAASNHNLLPIEKVSSTPPISPAPSEHSNLSTDDTSLPGTEIMTMMSPSQFVSTSPLKVNINEDSLGSSYGGFPSMELNVAEKDRKLQEKERQIEELKRKLEHEQKLVEELKMQLEVEKRSQQQHLESSLNTVGDQKHVNVAIKDENSLPNCSSSRAVTITSQTLEKPAVATGGQSIMGKKAVVIKQEVPVVKAEQQNIVSHLYMSHQRQTAVIAQPPTLLTTQPGTQLLFPVSIQTQNASPSLQLQTTNVNLQVFPSHTTTAAVFPYQSQPITAIPQCFINNSTNSVLQSRANPLPSVQNGPSSSGKNQACSPPQPPQQYVLQHSIFNNAAPKTKDPPRYEEAVKQSRNMQPQQTEASNAHSQQMDDLFDILIESGEMSPLVKEEPPPIVKMRPVTASITTMPVSTVVSRPPPQVQMGPPPVSLGPIGNLAIGSENQLEAFLDSALPSGTDIPQLTINQEDTGSLSLIEDLHNEILSHSNILDQPHSPMDTSEMHFTADSSCLSLELPDTNLDNMEWLDISMPSSTTGLTPLSSAVPSMFSTDFLDTPDLQLHWD
ncbi:myocardin-related transcription factor B isoform X2 [Latimeria chalumnae]|uniref:myocardin-related transcription factor B isoform X2 n=1 Tax=Latimeria chalumnae TaxID=7897 RepID=UPI00313A9D98